MCLRKRGSFQRNEERENTMYRIETNQELEAKRIAAMSLHEVEKQDIRKLEDAAICLGNLIESVKSDPHISEAIREGALKEIYTSQRQVQDNMKAMKEKRMQELLDLNDKGNIFTISNTPPFITVNYTHILDAVAMGYLDDGVIESLCKYHNNPDNAKKFEAINEAAKNFLRVIRDSCPECTGRVDAVKTVLLARMQANATIALSGV